MAALTVSVAGVVGTTPTGNTSSASDTVAIDTGLLILLFTGGAASDTVTVTDAGLTPAGNAGVSQTVVVPSGSTNFRQIKVPSSLQNSSNVVTVTHTAPTGVTTYALKVYA